MNRNDDAGSIMSALAEPFKASEVKWKPQSVKGNRALAICYVDCRVVQDRLDDVLGVENWQDSYDIVPDGSVVCRLSLKIGGEWITKTDVGSPSEQPDGGDRLKAAFSDALKRAAVKFGVGRYIYRLPNVWADYDPTKRQFVSVPQLPFWALPKGTAPAKPAPATQPDPPPPPPKAEIKSLADLAAAVANLKRPADAKAFGDAYDRVVKRLDGLVPGFDPLSFVESLAAALGLPAGGVPFHKLTAQQVDAGWTHIVKAVRAMA